MVRGGDEINKVEKGKNYGWLYHLMEKIIIKVYQKMKNIDLKKAMKIMDKKEPVCSFNHQ